MNTLLSQLVQSYLCFEDFKELSVSLGRYDKEALFLSFWLEKLTLDTFKTDGTQWQTKFDRDDYSDELCFYLLSRIELDTRAYLLPYSLSNLYEEEGDYKTQGYKGVRVKDHPEVMVHQHNAVGPVFDGRTILSWTNTQYIFP